MLVKGATGDWSLASDSKVVYKEANQIPHVSVCKDIKDVLYQNPLWNFLISVKQSCSQW